MSSSNYVNPKFRVAVLNAIAWVAGDNSSWVRQTNYWNEMTFRKSNPNGYKELHLKFKPHFKTVQIELIKCEGDLCHNVLDITKTRKEFDSPNVLNFIGAFL